MKDLRDAIKDVLINSTPSIDDMGEVDGYLVELYLLKILQAEYNIHFVEPEDEQLEVIQ